MSRSKLDKFHLAYEYNCNLRAIRRNIKLRTIKGVK